MFAGQKWQPTEILRVVRRLETSTKPLHVQTDVGPAILKYMGNPQGFEALICDYIGTELANLIGLPTPDFAILGVDGLGREHPYASVENGPVFLSKWEQSVPLSPHPSLLGKLRHPEHIAWLVIFDTWICNRDRFDPSGGTETDANFDNLLFTADGRKAKMLVIDHTHAFVETTLADEIDEDWVQEETVYGKFASFDQFLNLADVRKVISKINAVDVNQVTSICRSVPPEWDLTEGLAQRMSECIVARGQNLEHWVINKLFDQSELSLEDEEC